MRRVLTKLRLGTFRTNIASRSILGIRSFSVDGKTPTDNWDQTEDTLQWDDLEKEFENLDPESDLNLEEFVPLSSQDIHELSERPPYDMDPEHPPKLKKIHYHMVRELKPELYEEWVKLRTVKWKLQNKLKPLARFQFSNAHLDEYDKMAEWAKPVPRRNKNCKCKFCVPDLTPEKKNEIVFTNLELLHEHINERGMILGRRVTGLCGRHQRKITKAIKQARLAGLLSFTSNWKIPENFLEPVEDASAVTGSTPEVTTEVSEGAVTSVSVDPEALQRI